MENKPMRLKELNALIQERERLVRRLAVINPSPPTADELPDDPENPNQKLTVEQSGWKLPDIQISGGEKDGQYGSKQVLYSVSDELSSAIRLLIVVEWSDRIRMIDGELAAVRGVLQ